MEQIVWVVVGKFFAHRTIKRNNPAVVFTDKRRVAYSIILAFVVDAAQLQRFVERGTAVHVRQARFSHQAWYRIR